MILGALPSFSEYTRPAFGEQLERLARAALRHGVARDWPAVRQTLNPLSVLLRFAARLEELSVDQCRAIAARLAAAHDAIGAPG